MDSSLIMQSYIGEKSVKIDFDEIDKTALKIFQVFDYKISDFSFCTEKNKKLNSKYLKYTEKNKAKLIDAVFNDDCVDNIDYYSLNTSDFEPNSKLIVSIEFNDNYIYRINCVIDMSLLLPEFFSKYIETANILIREWQILSGYAFVFPNSFFPLSFSKSIFRKLSNPPKYEYIAEKIERNDWEDNKELIFMGNCNFLYMTDLKLRNSIISDLGSDGEYYVQDNYLFWKIPCKDDNVIDLIHSEQYQKIAAALTDNELLNDMTYDDF